MSIDYDLQDAADKLRQLARAISAPDARDQRFHAEGCDVTQGRRPDMYDVATTQTPELASYIAAMHPGVGAVLADWLGCLSALDPSERGGERCGWCSGDHAADMARAISEATA